MVCGVYIIVIISHIVRLIGFYYRRARVVYIRALLYYIYKHYNLTNDRVNKNETSVTNSCSMRACVCPFRPGDK